MVGLDYETEEGGARDEGVEEAGEFCFCGRDPEGEGDGVPEKVEGYANSEAVGFEVTGEGTWVCHFVYLLKKSVDIPRGGRRLCDWRTEQGA